MTNSNSNNSNSNSNAIQTQTRTSSSTSSTATTSSSRIQRLTERVNLILAHIKTNNNTITTNRDELNSIIKQIVEHNIDQRIRGKNNLAAAIIYVAARKLNLSITLKDILHTKHLTQELVNINRKKVSRIYKLIVNELNLTVQVVDYKTRLARIVYALEQRYPLDKHSSSIIIGWEAVKADSLKLLEEYSASGKLKGKDPTCYAAAALYMSLLNHGIHITQKAIADAALISDVALRLAYSHLRLLGRQK